MPTDTPTTTEDDLLTVEDVAALCHTAVGTVHYWRAQRPPKGPKGFKVGKRVLFRREVVEAWLADDERDNSDA